MMCVAIAMAGEGTRFLKVGFAKPKYELLVKGRPMFDWALESLRAFYREAHFVFIARTGARTFIAERCAVLGIPSFHVATLDTPTDGQATSVMMGIATLDKAHPLLIYNIDTHIVPTVFRPSDIGDEYDGWLLLFRALGTHWSFAKLDELGNVVDVSEKVRISEFASLGLYYFKSIAFFQAAYRTHADRTKAEYGEIYVMPLYQALIEDGQEIGTKIVDEKSVVILGTPEEVTKFDPDFMQKNL